MKVTVSFNTVKIVVPCGDGELTVRDLTQLATTRYKKATGKPRQSWVSVHSLKAKEGGILDPDDRLVDVCDDREQLIAFYNEEGVPQGGDGMSASSDESESTSGFSRNDIEVHSDHSSGVLQVRRGSEPALNRLSSTGSLPQENVTNYYDEHSKRWSAAVMSRDVRSSKNDLSVIDEASFYSESNIDGNNGKLSPLPPPFERGRGSGAARDSDRPTPFSRDSNRLSIQVGYEESKWLEAAERAARNQQSQSNSRQPSPVNNKNENSVSSSDLPKPRSIDAKIEMFESVSQRREPVGGTSPPQRTIASSVIDPDCLTHISIQNEIGPLGIHVVPSGDPVNPGLVIQGIEPGGRIDRNGTLAVNDRIIEINGHNLIDLPFNKSQEVFKEALYSKDLNLVVVKSRDDFDGFNPMGTNYFLSDENKENIENETDTFGTLGKKFGPGSKLTSAVQVANTRKIGKKINIKLLKGAHGLGFSLTTRDIQSAGSTPIYIKNILPKGAAIENGQLKPGDRLLEINDVSVDGKTQSDVVTILRNIPQNSEVDLVVSRQEKVDEMEQQQSAPGTLDKKKETLKPSLSRSGLPNNSSSVNKESESSRDSTVPNSEESEDFSSLSPDLQINQNGEIIFPWKHREILTLDIPVHDTERAGLGVSVKGKTTGGGAKGIVDLGIFVKNVIHGGAASRDGRLKTNDQLVNINGISLLGKANCDAMDTLRKAMHEEGPTPGVITLTVARRLNVRSASDSASKLRHTGRDSVSSMMTSSSGDDSYREYRIHENANRSINNSSLNDTSVTSNNDTVIYIEKPKPAAPPPPFSNFVAPVAPRNPVVDRLMGRKDKGMSDAALRNESYYRATGHDTWNTTMLQQLDVTDNGVGRLQSPTLHKASPETFIIEKEVTPEIKKKSGRPHSPDGCEVSEKDSDVTDVAYASQTSLEETSFAFARDQPGRQSMSEKRHATLDAKSTDTYQRNKKARQEREAQEKGEIGPMLGMKKSSSLESLQTMMTEMKMESGKQANRVKTSRVVRGRGCNESFRAAVDRSYEAQEVEDNPDIEITETFDRADYRQSGSSIDSNFAEKKKKNQKLFKGFGMFKFGKQRAKSSDAMRSSGRKTPTPETGISGGHHHQASTSSNEAAGSFGLSRDEEARERMLVEQAKIQQHYKRLLQQRQEAEAQAASDKTNRRSDKTDSVYTGESSSNKMGPPSAVPPPRDNALPASLVAARPGSRTGITGTASDPRFANYDEIQRHLNRRQAQYHSQRREHPNRSDRPVSNFYEYESVQSTMVQGRPVSGLPGYQHDVAATRKQPLPARQQFSPPRNSGRRQHQHRQSQYPTEGAGLSVAPLTMYEHGKSKGRGDYEDYRADVEYRGEMEDPYARVVYRNRIQTSQSGSRLHPQVPSQGSYVTALPPGSKV